MSGPHPDGYERLSETYRRGLLDDVIPFWLRHGLDRAASTCRARPSNAGGSPARSPRAASGRAGHDGGDGRANRKWVITGSLFVWSAVTLAMGFARTFGQLYALRAVMGLRTDEDRLRIRRKRPG